LQLLQLFLTIQSSTSSTSSTLSLFSMCPCGSKKPRRRQATPSIRSSYSFHILHRKEILFYTDIELKAEVFDHGLLFRIFSGDHFQACWENATAYLPDVAQCEGIYEHAFFIVIADQQLVVFLFVDEGDNL